MSKIQTSILLVFSFIILAMSQTSKHYSEDNQIQNPLPFVPTNQQDSLKNNQVLTEDSDSKEIEEYVPSKERKQQNEDFNEVLGYGMISGIVALGFTILRTCLIEEGARRVRFASATVQQNAMNLNQSRGSSSYEILNQIHIHEYEIIRLQRLLKQVQGYERQALQTQRQSQAINSYHMQFQQRMVPQNDYTHGQQTYGQVFSQQQVDPSNEFIPVGRPLSEGIDLQFAKKYPTI